MPHPTEHHERSAPAFVVRCHRPGCNDEAVLIDPRHPHPPLCASHALEVIASEGAA